MPKLYGNFETLERASLKRIGFCYLCREHKLNLMAKSIPPQPYPRIPDEEDKFHGFLDEPALAEHSGRIDEQQVKAIITQAIRQANAKSGRQILNVPPDAAEEEVKKIYEREGKKLFDYFLKYYGDPASTAFECEGLHYSDVAREQFRNRTLQKQRMNSGWRYQFIAKDCAITSGRFVSVSDIGASEADFNAVAKFKDNNLPPLNIYVSVKNRSNTMGGQDWPKAISALEQMAAHDKNRYGPFICVFGIVMERGTRTIRKENKTGRAYSVNTEIWFSDFFWPFFSNYTYSEMMQLVLDVLKEQKKEQRITPELFIPKELIESFGISCQKFELLDDEGYFNDPDRLLDLFCNKK